MKAQRTYASDGARYMRYYAPGVLQIAVHDRLVLGLQKYADTAGIHPRFIYEKTLSAVCGPVEVDWAKRPWVHMQEGKAGLCYVGEGSVIDRMSALAGFFVRNFIDARLMMRERLLDWLKEGEEPDARLLLVPNFHLGKGKGGALPEWQGSYLLDCLLSRYSASRPTVVAVGDLGLLSNEHGKILWEHLTEKFLQVKIGGTK